MVVYLPSSLVGWRSWFVAGLGCLRLWIRPRPKSVDFHDVRNRQRPCRMTIRHPKNSFSACLAWVISAKLNTFAYGMYGFASLRLWCLPLEYTSTGLAWLLTRPAPFEALPEWMVTTCSNALDSMNTQLSTSPVGIGRLGVKLSRNQARALDK
ncbi:ras-specific guanine nucleotide-releasing factor RalGPS2 [Trichonephila clavipes]|nr:ras-specific guanine nucleotide-releasing factor RalGPS2 [Trichonephila clavipes]